MRRSWLTSPTALAVFVTLANAAKPVVVDDTAYLLFARQIAAEPWNPYGFELFWYTQPQPAMTVLAPPVVPYWLAAGVRLFGENVPLLKCWLFPFVWLFARSADALLRRYARQTGTQVLLLLLVSPTVLPMVNLMLDVPAAALGLAAVVLLTRAADSGSWRGAAAAGLVGGLAAQTKYTMLLLPVVMLWYGLVYHQLARTVVAVAVAVAAFAVWETWLDQRYGQSHFVLHALSQAGGPPGGERLETWVRIVNALEEKSALVGALVAYLGGLAGAVGFYGAAAVGVPRRLIALAGGVTTAGLAAVVYLPRRHTILGPDGGTSLTVVLWWTLGVAVLLVTLRGVALLLLRCEPKRARISLRSHSRDSLFLAGWLLLELAGTVVLSPFPAGRRVVGVSVVAALLVARVAGRVGRARPGRRPPTWVVPAGVAAGVLFALLDGYDAWVEKAAAGRAAAVVRDAGGGGEVWFVGHWGFEFYCKREGMSPYIPGRSEVRPGDWLVVPDYPDSVGFYRPYPGRLWYTVADDEADRVRTLVFDDAISGKTVPAFYGDSEPVPINGRDRPRLSVGVYRVRTGWHPERSVTAGTPAAP